MTEKFLTKEKLFTHTAKLADVLFESNGYEDFDKNIMKNIIEYNPEKTYEIASSNFFDFNNHLYEDINHMNSISCGIYIEKSLITYRIFIWSSKGEGFEIFKHILRGNEISSIKNEEDIKNYFNMYLNELEEGIEDTYKKDTKYNFEQFGGAIESKALPIANILKYISIENNIKDFQKY